MGRGLNVDYEAGLRREFGLEESYQKLQIVIRDANNRVAEINNVRMVFSMLMDLLLEDDERPLPLHVARLKARTQDLFDSPHALGSHEHTRDGDETEVMRRMYRSQIKDLLSRNISPRDRERLKNDDRLLELGEDPTKIEPPQATIFSN